MPISLALSFVVPMLGTLLMTGPIFLATLLLLLIFLMLLVVIVALLLLTTTLLATLLLVALFLVITHLIVSMVGDRKTGERSKRSEQ